MLGELNQDIMGANPKYPPINNLEYLTVDPTTYDNYPSDNNSVRIQPKLSELWNHGRDCGIKIIPNLTVQSLGIKRADEDVNDVITEIVREAKKAMMMGLNGRELAAYLRPRFKKEHLLAAKGEMERLAKLQGLLGNVYIDVSAFSSARDAEQFLTIHPNRLARYIVANEKDENYNVACYIANKFHKDVVPGIFYDKALFQKYKAHLVDAGVIDNDYVIDSSESLRMAFLSPPVKQRIVSAKAVKKESITRKKVAQEISNRTENAEITNRLASEDILFKSIYPILEFTRKNLIKGKNSNALKEMLRKRYASNDLRSASRYIAIVISSRITPEHIDKLVESKKISKMIGLSLKKLAKEYPFKKESFETQPKIEKQIGVPGRFYVLSGNNSSVSEYHEDTVKSLHQGKAIEEIKDNLLKKLSDKEADSVLLNAVKSFNECSAGVKANPFEKVSKKKLVADLKEPEVLPDPKTIIPQINEFVNFYKDAEMRVDIDDIPETKLLEIDGLDSKSGLDHVL